MLGRSRIHTRARGSGAGAGSTTTTDLLRLIALSPSLLIWPAEGAGWQGTSGGTLAASGQPLGLGADLSQLQGKTLAEWLATAPELLNGSPTAISNWTYSAPTATFGGSTSGDVYWTISGLTIGQAYYATASVSVASNGPNGQFQVRLGSTGTAMTPAVAAATTSTGEKNLVFIATETSHRVRAFDDGTTQTQITNFSLKALPGNHLRAGTWASPSDSARGMFQNDAINFDGVDDYYSLLNGINITTNMTVVRAFKRASAGINSIGTGQTTAFNPYEHWWLNSNNNNYSALGPTVRDAGAANTNTGSFVTTACRSASLEKLRLNGTQVISVSAATASGSLTALGRISSVYNAGEISFLALFPSELTGADLTLVEQIAASTNGATLA